MIVNVIHRDSGKVSQIRSGKRKNNDPPDEDVPSSNKPSVTDTDRGVIAVRVIRSQPIIQFLGHNNRPSVQSMVKIELSTWRNNYKFDAYSRRSPVDGRLNHRNTDGSTSIYNCDIKYINHGTYPVNIPTGTILMVHANKPQIEAGLFLVTIMENDHFRVYLCELAQEVTPKAPRKASKKTREFQST